MSGEQEQKSGTVLSLKEARLAAKAQKKQQQADKIDSPEHMLNLARAIIEHHNLVVDSEAQEADHGTQVFKINAETNTLKEVSTTQLDTIIFQAEPGYMSKGRAEVAKYVEKELLSDSHRCRDLSTVPAVALADEMETLCHKRLKFTKADAVNISLDNLPEFKFVLSLTSDPQALVYWIGSLLDADSSRVQYLHWYGGGGNGKSALFSAIELALGSGATVRASVEDIMSAHWGTQLVGSRLLIVPDTNSTKVFSSGRWKEITGDKYFTVNPKNKPHRLIALTQKIAVLSNSRVSINNSDADARRLLPISSKPDPAGNVPFKWWYEGLTTSGEQILLYCYSEWMKAVEADPKIRAGIAASKEALADAVEERYGDVLALIEDVLEITVGQALPTSAHCVEVYKALGEARGRILSAAEMKEIKEALALLGVNKTKTKKGRVFENCRIKGGR